MSCKYIIGNKEYTEQEVLSYINDNKNTIVKENRIEKVDSVYINKDTADDSTLLHEYQHLFLNWIKTARPELYAKGIDLIKKELEKGDKSEIKDIFDFVKQTQPTLTGGALLEEYLTEYVGRESKNMMDEQKSKSSLMQWLSDFWASIKDMLGLLEATPEQVSKMTLKDFADASAVQMLKGENFVGKEGKANFNRWKGDNELVSSSEIQEVRTGQPIVAKVYHGTTNEFYEFDASVKGNIEGHLGKVNYFTSDYGDANANYLSEGADITGRIDRRAEEIESELEGEYGHSILTPDELDEVILNFNLDEDFAEDDVREIAKIIAEKELKGTEEKVLELYVKLNNPVVLGNGATWFDALEIDEVYLEEATQEIAEEYDITEEEAKSDYEWEIRDRAVKKQGNSNKIVEALEEALDDNGYDSSLASDILGDNYYEAEVDLNKLEQDLRNAELYDNYDGELASSQVIADFFKKLGFDGIILTDVAQRFKNMGLSNSTSHIHVFDEFNNQIKLADGSNVTFGETSDIRYSKAPQKPIVQVGGAKVFAKKQVNATNDKPTGRIELDLITSENKGNGEAREAMKQFLQIMDANKQEVYLMVSPRDKQTSFGRLVKFYESFGFRLEPSGIEMVRRPKKVIPPTEDKNGEAKADEVIKFSKTTDEKLSKEELIEAMDSAVSLGVETSEELLENLDFNEYEQMKVDMSKVERLKAKLKNTPFSVPLIEVEKTSKVNSFGKQVPQVKQPTIPVQTVDENGNIIDKLSETKEVLQLTYPENKKDNLMPKLVGAIQKINNEIFNENSKLVYAVIEDIKEEALDFGVDLKDIENRVFPFQKLKDFLSALQEYTINPTAEFAKVYDEFFNVAPLMAYKPTFSSEFSEYELYDKFNLIRVGDTYQKVETPKLEPSIERQAKIAQLQVDDFRTDVVKLEEMVYHKEQLGQPLKTLPIEEVESVNLRGVKKNPYLKVTAKGVALINQDPLTLEKAMVYGYEPQVKETVEKIETDYSVIEDVLVTDLNNKSKVRTPLGVYTKIMDFQNKSIYTANLKNKTVNIKALLEKSDISPKIEAKKYYTKEEYDKNFSCL